MRRGERNPCLIVIKDNTVIFRSYKYSRKELLNKYPGCVVLSNDKAELQMIHNPKDNTFKRQPKPTQKETRKEKRRLIDVLEENIHALIKSLDEDEKVSGPAKKRLQIKLREFTK